MMEEVGLMTKEAMERAYRLAHTELRARALVDSAVVQALRTVGDPDERDFERYAHDVAMNAAAMLMEYIYENDAELKAIRVERDRYRELAEQGFRFASPSLMVQAPSPK